MANKQKPVNSQSLMPSGWRQIQVNILLDNIFEQRKKNGRLYIYASLYDETVFKREPPFEALISRDWEVAAGPQSPQLLLGVRLDLQGWLGRQPWGAGDRDVTRAEGSASINVVLIAHLNSALEFEAAETHLM